MSSSQPASSTPNPDALKTGHSDLPTATAQSTGQKNQISLQNQSSWIVEGIKHEIFMRIFPSLRHGLVGPISIARMSISIVRRLLARDEVNLTALNEPVERIDQQLAEAVLGIRTLQNWESGGKPQVQPAANIISEGIALMTAPLAMREIVLDYAAPEQETTAVSTTLLYTWLGLLCYFQDSLQQTASLKIQLQAQSVTVQLLLTEKPQGAARSKPSSLANARVIDQAALEALAAAGNFSLSFQPDSVHLGWN